MSYLVQNISIARRAGVHLFNEIKLFIYSELAITITAVGSSKYYARHTVAKVFIYKIEFLQVSIMCHDSVLAIRYNSSVASAILHVRCY